MPGPTKGVSLMKPRCRGQSDWALRANTRHRSRAASSARTSTMGVAKFPDTTMRGSGPGRLPRWATRPSTETIRMQPGCRPARRSVPYPVEDDVGHPEPGLDQAPAVSVDGNALHHEGMVDAYCADVTGHLSPADLVRAQVDGAQVGTLLPSQDFIG